MVCRDAYIARFIPQEWRDDWAVNVRPEGLTEWDCTESLLTLVDSYLMELLDEMGVAGEALDRHDALKHDPKAPEWVREWMGPFEIRVRPPFPGHLTMP